MYTRVIILCGLDISGPFPFSVCADRRADRRTDGYRRHTTSYLRLCIANPETTLMGAVEVMWVRGNNGGAGVVDGFLIDHHYTRYFILLYVRIIMIIIPRRYYNASVILQTR